MTINRPMMVSLIFLVVRVLATCQQPAENEIKTNLAGVTTIAAPPEGFDPLMASDSDLAYFGFPPRPDPSADEKAYASWRRAMLAASSRITPALEPSEAVTGAAKETSPRPEVAPTALNSYNWSGDVGFSGTNSYGSSSFYFAIAEYMVPRVRQPLGKCSGGWDYAQAWVGIDGWGSGDVLQAGTEMDAYCHGSNTSEKYYFWYGWYPNGQTRVSNLSVEPGDQVYVEVWNTTATAGHAYLFNYRTNKTVTINFSAPAGTTLVGNSTEWIISRPTVKGILAQLSGFNAQYFSSAYAGTFASTVVVADGSSTFPVTMLDDQTNAETYTTLLGPEAFLVQTEGTAH